MKKRIDRGLIYDIDGLVESFLAFKDSDLSVHSSIVEWKAERIGKRDSNDLCERCRRKPIFWA